MKNKIMNKNVYCMYVPSIYVSGRPTTISSEVTNNSLTNDRFVLVTHIIIAKIHL